MSNAPSSYSRRDALKATVLLGASAGLASTALGKSGPTPAQTEGPFYPDLDNDLTFVASRKERAQGDHLYVHGVVSDTDGKPVSNALVDIWQTDHQGIYDHAGDPNQGKKDKNFQCYGRFVTGEDGTYHFKSIKPRHYGDEKFLRTPHIHYKVARRGYHELTTQLYFAGEKFNDQDGLYNKLSAEDQKLVTVDFQSIEKADKTLQKKLKKDFGEGKWPKGISVGQLDLVMKPV
ncbi:MAG: protocatechuate 3,4-dioxygenase beta subunit [Verrucomicrobiales bacterium]|jgi:protocatechuate 3,4-dioxygenase beta subunit